MNRLSKSEIRDTKREFEKWHSSDSMKKLFDEVSTKLGSENFFNQSGLSFLREAFIACKFASAIEAQKIRLVQDNWPDFEIIANGKLLTFEIVEADDPIRKRGLEYRSDTLEIIDDPIEDWIARSNQAGDWIRSACQWKFEKHYTSGSNLVIFLNMNEWGIRQNEIVSIFPESTEIIKDSFDSVWILWKNKIYNIWKNGKFISINR